MTIHPSEAQEDELLHFVHRLADTAGEIARTCFQQTLAIETKTDHSPVTRADKEIEASIIHLIRKHYPGHGIYGEESGWHQEDAEWVWVIDPIDGTRAFIAGRDTFVTLIALCRHGIPIIGVIDQPIRKERWVGCNGLPTRLNNQITVPRDCTSLNQAVISTTSRTYFDPAQTQAYSRVCAEAKIEIQPGQDGYAYALITSGQMDIVIDAHLKPYDFCALAPVIIGAGGIISGWEGEPLTLQSDGRVLAAATKQLADAAHALLNGAV